MDQSARLDQGKVSNRLELTLVFPELAKHPVSVGITPLPAPIFQQSRLVLLFKAGDGQTSTLQLGSASNGQVPLVNGRKQAEKIREQKEMEVGAGYPITPSA